MHAARSLAAVILFATAVLAIGPMVSECPAQQTATFTNAPKVEKKESFLVWAKTNHLNYYMAGYSTVMSILAGFVISALAYRFTEKSKSYKLAKVRTTAWAAALGLGLGVAVAVMQVPSTQQGKLRSLLISVAISTLATPAVTYANFVAFRRLHILIRGKSGRPSSTRMDLL